MLAHLEDIKEIQEPIKLIDMSSLRLNVMAPAAELEKLRPEMERRGAIMWTMDNEAFWM